MSNAFIETLKNRRSQYALGEKVHLSQDEITQLVKQAVKYSPSAFNSQSSRVVILFTEHSKAFWTVVKDELRKLVPAEAFAATENKINSFAAGAGTVLFYEDQAVVEDLQQRFAAYADNFPIWSEQASGMAQLAVWSVLASENIGASLQHYNPLPDARVAAQWNIPSSWKLRAQMPFGSNEAGFADKAIMDDQDRFLVFN